jgi:hypothetical protein
MCQVPPESLSGHTPAKNSHGRIECGKIYCAGGVASGDADAAAALAFSSA